MWEYEEENGESSVEDSEKVTTCIYYKLTIDRNGYFEDFPQENWIVVNVLIFSEDILSFIYILSWKNDKIKSVEDILNMQ